MGERERERRNEARNPKEETERQAKKEGTGVGIDLSGQGSRVCSVFSARERERKKERRKKKTKQAFLFKQEVKEVPTDTSVFKNHQLPLARIKKIMKSDEDVRMISAEAPVLFAKACELFILELTLRSWMHSEESKRRTLQRNDIAAAITKTDVFDFLLDIVPREEATALWTVCARPVSHGRSTAREEAIGQHFVPYYIGFIVLVFKLSGEEEKEKKQKISHFAIEVRAYSFS